VEGLINKIRTPLRNHNHGSCERSRDLAARHHLAAASPQRQGRMGPGSESRIVLLPAYRHLRGRHLQGKAIELGNYPYPIFVVTDRSPPTRSMPSPSDDHSYDIYKDAAAGAGGLAAERQTKKWVVPVHPGAVKALKEAGQWSDDQEAHNKCAVQDRRLSRRHGRLRQSKPPADERSSCGLMTVRAAALKEANMPNGFDE